MWSPKERRALCLCQCQEIKIWTINRCSYCQPSQAVVKRRDGKGPSTPTFRRVRRPLSDLKTGNNILKSILWWTGSQCCDARTGPARACSAGGGSGRSAGSGMVRTRCRLERASLLHRPAAERNCRANDAECAALRLNLYWGTHF